MDWVQKVTESLMSSVVLQDWMKTVEI